HGRRGSAVREAEPPDRERDHRQHGQAGTTWRQARPAGAPAAWCISRGEPAKWADHFIVRGCRAKASLKPFRPADGSPREDARVNAAEAAGCQGGGGDQDVEQAHVGPAGADLSVGVHLEQEDPATPLASQPNAGGIAEDLMSLSGPAVLRSEQALLQ